MEVEFSGAVWHWRGPAPFHYVTVPEDQAAEIADLASAVSYGWGMVPVTATLGLTTWTTSLFPKDGGYVVPLKAKVRRAEGVDLDDIVALTLRIDLSGT